MSAPELTPIELAMHDVLRRAITTTVMTDANRSYHFSKLSEGEKVEVRKRLVTLSNLHTAVRDGDDYSASLGMELDRLRGWFLRFVEHITAPFNLAPDMALVCCQVADPSVRDAFTCSEHEQGGALGALRCEMPGNPEWHDHGLSEHTKLHDLRGNGYSCESIDAAIIARRNEQDGAAR